SAAARSRKAFCSAGSRASKRSRLDEFVAISTAPTPVLYGRLPYVAMLGWAELPRSTSDSGTSRRYEEAIRPRKSGPQLQRHCVTQQVRWQGKFNLKSQGLRLAALAWQARGRRFESAMLHSRSELRIWRSTAESARIFGPWTTIGWAW